MHTPSSFCLLCPAIRPASISFSRVRSNRQTSTMAPLATHPETDLNYPLRQISQPEQYRSPLSTLSNTIRLSKALIGRHTCQKHDVAGSGVKAFVLMPFRGGGAGDYKLPTR
ncbi:hypothetical protein CH63R_10276 [Colletotrichum higginsianum IMI 349063]|uniref:Uncharacterized protein n=1 Tax=Colletotrichum higginsianum (strain IMI 349063) TaxID=759273 RepID=A0A1B7Y2E0_COLHI|nr:uncharacterized protein CH63R_10276 [Colletotrichum higginsianum IMI 349063]OBR06156.1 hypothetical protein CH63R_10276 [Colletotrichum higginsianum IMI 349063]